MKTLRTLLLNLGILAAVLTFILVVNQMTKRPPPPWPEVVTGLPAARATAALGQTAQQAGISLSVTGTRMVQARDIVDENRLSSRAAAQPGQAFLVLSLLLYNKSGAPVTFQPFGTRPNVTLLLGVAEPQPRPHTVLPVMPTDIVALGNFQPLKDLELRPGEEGRGDIGFAVDSSYKAMSLLVFPAPGAGVLTFPAFEIALD